MFRSGILARPFLYAIVDTDVCRGHALDPVELAEAYLAGGARVLQLRDKAGSSAAFLALADRVVRLAQAVDALVVVNDRADIAQLSGAGGVHVGQDDLAPADVRRILGPAGIIGVSTHDARQVDAALDAPATYLAVGPIFGTTTKDTGYSARGLDLVRYAAGRGKPVVAIGGMTLDRVAEIVAAGASGVAVITDLLSAGDPAARVRAFVAALSP